ncbi:hypothetical protein SAMN04488102_10389 [Alkalibacterium subtropicum]|uniref:Uncharacterized protein n=1 Tax=Alkalibacterium subtropicum TaxID=753702 RepID=A0A1I1GI12_9LACT|nr:hypothetical protein [Alkalibacterium subtropicum]SFC11194.1 hypothetical protein SAMN04488102_10389 [Alkalibacterium subtropicum]
MEKILWTEIKRFIKRNVKKVIVLSVVIGLIYTLAANMLMGQNGMYETDDTLEVTEELAEYYSGFQVYIEYDDGRSFANTTLLEEYILQPELIEEAEASTGVEILSRIEQLEATGFEKSGDDRGVLGVIRGTYSDIFTVLVNVGTDSENVAVAEFYLDELTTEDVSFLESKELHVWSEPQVLSDAEDAVPESGDLGNDVGDTTVVDYMIDWAIGTVFGFIISTLVLIFWSLLRDRDLYAFTYNRGSDDVFLLYDADKNNADEVAQLIVYPLNYNKIVIHHSRLPDALKDALEKKSESLPQSVDYVPKMADASVKSDRTEVVIMIDSLNDSKKWYRKQRLLADTYQLPVKVVQINS